MDLLIVERSTEGDASSPLNDLFSIQNSSAGHLI